MDKNVQGEKCKQAYVIEHKRRTQLYMMENGNR